MVTSWLSLPSGTEPVCKFLAVVREKLGHFKGDFLDQSGKEATGILRTLVCQNLKIHPTGGSVNGYEKELFLGFVCVPRWGYESMAFVPQSPYLVSLDRIIPCSLLPSSVCLCFTRCWRVYDTPVHRAKHPLNSGPGKEQRVALLSVHNLSGPNS